MRVGIVCFFLLLGMVSYGQSDVSVGWLPKINLSSKLGATTKWVNSIETRELVYKDRIRFLHKLVDVSSLISIKTDINQSLNLGYILRIEDRELVHRLFQQYNIVHNIASFKLGHRIGVEEHFPEKSKPFYRGRYRVSVQKALQGTKLDVHEFYIKFGHECVYHFNDKSLEIRFSPYVGYQASKKDKVEVGVEYRANDLLADFNTHRFWFRTTWYISL